MLSPLPHLNWVDRQVLWNQLKTQEAEYMQSLIIFERHTDITPHARGALLFWLSEVCDLLVFLRETYYLAVEIVDRFLLCSTDIPLSQLQLTGVTALFMAAKMEEVVPPRAKQLVDLTDGACNLQQVLEFETFMSQKLEWLLSAPTANTWLQLYLQVHAAQRRKAERTPEASSCETDTSDVEASINPEASAFQGRKDKQETDTSDMEASINPEASAFQGRKDEQETDTSDMEASINPEASAFQGRKDKQETDTSDMEASINPEASAFQGRKDEQSCDTSALKTDTSVLETDSSDLNVSATSEVSALVRNAQSLDLSESGFFESSVGSSKDLSGYLESSVDCECDSTSEEKTKGSCQFHTAEETTDDSDEEMGDESWEEETEEHVDILQSLYHPPDYVKVSLLMDLVILDSNSLRFRYSVLAAAVLFHSDTVECQDIFQLTGLTREELEPCIHWMTIHALMLASSKQNVRDDVEAVCPVTGLVISVEHRHKFQECVISENLWLKTSRWSDRYFVRGNDQIQHDAVVFAVKQECVRALSRSETRPSRPNSSTSANNRHLR